MQETNTVKERLALFLKKQELSQERFAKIVGVSKGWANNVGDSIRKNTLEKIKYAFPTLNTNWLLTGEGKMLNIYIDDDLETDTVSDSELSYQKDSTNKLLTKTENDMVNTLIESLQLAHKEIKALKKENEELREKLTSRKQNSVG